MRQTPTMADPPPPTRGELPILIGIGTFSVTVVSFLAWASVAWLVYLSREVSDLMLFSPLVVVPAGVIGAVRSWRNGSRLGFCAGLGIAMLPAVLLVAAVVVFDPAPSALAEFD